ncbi:MAG: hypothetical protein CVU97_00265 [Firmicutes bacterium HGW-Firmicutes-21]|nr:MAG: hypothetical protein CVU97_00265 [Firmicutes bacterium HGW-Firmicutes-21]
MRKDRLICLFLVLLMTLTLTVSCTVTPVDDESGTSEDTSKDTSEDTTDYSLVKASIDALYTSEIDRTLAQVNLSLEKSYTPSYQAHPTYPDTNAKLTDGVFAEGYFGSNKEPWVGYNSASSGSLTIELDLAASYSGIADLGISFCNNLSSGIGLPTKVEFYAFNNGEYTLINTSITPKVLDAPGLYTASLKLQGGITASKIKIACVAPRSSWLFVDEIFVYKYEGENPLINKPTKYYDEVVIPEITEPTYWSQSDSDYNTEKNLLAGLTQQIAAYATLDGDLATAQKNTPASAAALTDGRYATVAKYDAAGWFRFTRGLQRDIYYDLGNTSAVSGYSVGFLKEDSSGVKLPPEVKISASENGTDWQEIHKITNLTSAKESDIVRVAGKFARSYRARYIKISFAVTSHVYADEFQITGTKKVGNAKEIIPDIIEEIVYPNKYASPEDFNGIQDVLLSYICHPSIAPITKEIYLPHVAYIENGVIKDTLFDSYMFLPYVAYLYDGGTKKPLKKEDWQYYMDVQFTKDRNMDALDAAVKETKDALGKSDYKVGVFLSILYPVSEVTSFGEIGGKNLNFSKVEDRKTAIKWLIDEQIRVFDEKGYKNLYIEGFYWFTEEINYSDSQLLELISYTTEYVRSLGYITSWIPYYQASGYNEWAKLGFDLACYQPNFAFNFNIPDQRLFDAAEAAKLLGMCIELEIGGTSTEHVDRMKKYYAVGALTGYMTDAVHMYYQGGVPGSIYTAYNSTDKYINSLYEDTYKFIKGTFNPSTPAAESVTLDCTVSEKLTGSIAVESANMVKIYKIVTSPKYGTIQMNLDGSFVYTPTKGITGQDYFEVVTDYGYDTSEVVRITINIK